MRLIDADALIKTLGIDDLPIRLTYEIENAPTVDAVPVIRCKDCKHHYYHELLKQDYCEIPNMQFGEIDPNGYCHRAKRKE